jgi:putative ABC transport system permease protein
MEIRSIVSSLRRHRIVMWLLVVEVALTCAVICNAVFLIAQRLDHMHTPSGVPLDELVQVQQAPITPLADRYARAQADLAALRQIPGVQSVGLTNQVPFGGSSSNGNVLLDPEQQHATVNVGTYFGENLVPTYGLRLVAGRDLMPDEYIRVDVLLKALAAGSTEHFPMPTLITQALARRLWPGQGALGRLIYLTPKASFRVVGVVAGLARANAFDEATAQFSMIAPVQMGADKDESYLLRTRPQDRARVLAEAAAVLKRADPGRVITHTRTLEDVRQQFFQDDLAMAAMLVGVIVALLGITALGIVGLASFWVGQRRRQIGVRRALGATRRDILVYFQTENFLIVSAGVALGMTLAYAANLLLMARYELPRLPLWYLPVGALALWALGQLAVLGPALRAAAVPPVVATRSV